MFKLLIFAAMLAFAASKPQYIAPLAYTSAAYTAPYAYSAYASPYAYSAYTAGAYPYSSAYTYASPYSAYYYR